MAAEEATGDQLLDRYLELTGAVDEATLRVRQAIRQRDNYRLIGELISRADIEMKLRDLDYGNGIDWDKWMRQDVDRAVWLWNQEKKS